jgi:hypothetical protein
MLKCIFASVTIFVTIKLVCYFADPCFYRKENTYWVEFVLIHACTTELVCFALGTVLNLAFALSVLGFLIMHMSLVAGNTTTIEVFLATIPFSSHHVLPVSCYANSAYGRTLL